MYRKSIPLLFLWLCRAGAQTVVNSADYSAGVSTGIPRGSIFTIFGARLADSPATATALPLSTMLNGVTVKIDAGTSNGQTLILEAPLLYVSPSQINAILPSSTPEGVSTISILVGSRQIPAGKIAVTSGRFTAFTQWSRGSGPAVIQQYDSAGQASLNRLTAAATPGVVMTIWGTGLGPLGDASDAAAPSSGNLRDDVTVFIDGVAVKPRYAGRAPGYPGVDQINFELPTTLQRPRCFTPLVISTGGVLSTGATVAISSSGSTCDSELNLPASALASPDNGNSLRIAVLSFRAVNGQQSADSQQSAESWIADYDATYLSYLVNGEGAGLPQGVGLCETDHAFDGTFGLRSYLVYDNYSPTIFNTPKLCGLRRDPSPPIPTITGPQNCTWSFTLERDSATDLGIALGNGPQCPAQAFQYSSGLSATGTLPAYRSNADIAAFSVHGPVQSLAADWTAKPVPGDSIVLMASSYIFGMAPIQHAIACKLSPNSVSFVFPQPQTALVFSRFYNPVVITLTNVTTRAFATNNPAVDFVVVRTSNSAVNSASIQ